MAEPVLRDSSDDAAPHVLARRMMGGVATVPDPDRMSDGGRRGVAVICRIAGLDGWECVNSVKWGAECVSLPFQGAPAVGGWLSGDAGTLFPVLE